MVEFSEEVFNHLVSDQRPRDMLLRLVESQKIASDIAEDPIPEKGNDPFPNVFRPNLTISRKGTLGTS
jgi:hypothetical protein